MSDGTPLANERSTPPIEVTVVEARSWWAENIISNDHNFLKINCEGCEVGVLESLLAGDSPAIATVRAAIIDFDAARLYAQTASREQLSAAIRAAGVILFDPRETNWCAKTMPRLPACEAEERMEIFIKKIRRDDA